MAVLVDTSVLVAYAFSKDVNHSAARRLIQSLAGESPTVATPVLVELFYLTTVRINYDRAVMIFAATHRAFHIEAMSDSDMVRMQEIMTQYRDAKLDFTDTVIMALSERLNITQVCTFDRRDFSIFRPKHCPALELLP